jgi:hypothetical protein
MINTNAIIIEFFGQNWIGIMVAINLFKVIAVLTPSNKDDSVVALFSDTFDMIKNMGNAVGNIAKLPFKKQDEKMNENK